MYILFVLFSTFLKLPAYLYILVPTKVFFLYQFLLTAEIISIYIYIFFFFFEKFSVFQSQN